MKLFSKIRRELKFIKTSKRMLKAVDNVNVDSTNLVTDDIERVIDKYPNNTAFISDDRQWSFLEFDAYANKVAHWALSEGFKKGDTIAVFIINRFEYVAIWFGLSKIGVIPALINYQLRAKALAHCVSIANAKGALVDKQLENAWKSAKADLRKNLVAYSAFGVVAGLEGFTDNLGAHSSIRPSREHRVEIKAGNLFMKMFTSGTTGMPKAAKVTHVRAQYYMRGFVVPSASTQTDKMMMVLPLYHATGGLCGVGMAIMQGGAVIIREQFSVSSFWSDAVRFEATMFMYVGELCRFLLNAPKDAHERAHKIRCIVGNGLRPEVWDKFVTRFNIPHVVEFYGATEGNINLINFEGKMGSVGRIPEYLRKEYNGDLIRYDVENRQHNKDKNGFCERTSPGEIGELIGEIKQGAARFHYEGYESKEASEKKILHDVFKKGDRWFSTGDLLWRDKEGYYYFADRMGDTFRWKAENVSTNEVAAAITEFSGVEQANVYGVAIPGYDGKAGMASLVNHESLDLGALYKHIEEVLPSYAQPVFLRLCQETDTTGTFKYKKTNLVKDGFDPNKVKDDLYIAHPVTKSFEKLTPKIFKEIQNQKLRL
ncbi:MAG: long-chain-acyl-CoA synthetase [Robiginitomaculum sp.]